MAFEWYRRWHETEGDVKFLTISRQTGKHITWIKCVWETALSYASKNPDRGSVEGLCEADVATENGLTDEDAKTIIKAFVSKGMIAGNRIAAWDKRQFLSDKKTDNTGAERQANFRAKKKTKKDAEINGVPALPDNSNACVTPSNACVTPPDSDTDTDIKKGKELPSGSSKKPATQKIGLDDLTVGHIEEWLSGKRASGIYVDIDENELLEYFKNYCRSSGKTYKDYRAAFQIAFTWGKCGRTQTTKLNQPKGNGHDGKRDKRDFNGAAQDIISRLFTENGMEPETGGLFDVTPRRFLEHDERIRQDGGAG